MRPARQRPGAEPRLRAARAAAAGRRCGTERILWRWQARLPAARVQRQGHAAVDDGGESMRSYPRVISAEHATV